MTYREFLAKLSSHLTLPLPEYIATEAAENISKNLDLLSKLEPFHLPEIIKLISGHPALIKRFSPKYDAIYPFYENNSIDSFSARFSDKSIDSMYYIDCIFPFADLSIIENFIFTYNRIALQIKNLEKTLEEKDKKEKHISNEISSIEDKINEIKETMLPFPSDSDDPIFLSLKKNYANLKGKLTRNTNLLKKLHSENESDINKISFLCEQRGRLSEAYQIALKYKENYSHTISGARNAAYEVLDEKHMLKQYLDQLMSSNVAPDTFKTELKNFKYVNHMLSFIETNYKDSYICIIAKLYENSYIDIYDFPLCDFLGSHANEVSLYILENYLTPPKTNFDISKTDFNSWLDFIIEKEFLDDDCSNSSMMFSMLWDHIPSIDCWRSIISAIISRNVDKFISCLSRLLLKVSGKSRRYLLSLAIEMIQQEYIDSYSSLIVSLIDIHSPGDDCSALVELLLQQLESETNKLKGTNDRLLYNEKRLPANTYSSIAPSIEKLELLASNISSGDNTLSPSLIVTKLKKNIVELRKGLESFGVHPVEDPDNWVNQTVIPFNHEFHSINISTPPQQVYLRSIGFSYADIDGTTKISRAIVGRLQDLSSPSINSKKQKKAKPSSKSSSPIKEKPKKVLSKDGAKS